MLYKYIIIFILIYYRFFKFKYVGKTLIKYNKNNESKPTLKNNYISLNFSNEITNIEQRKLYIKNKTQYYSYIRTKYLLRYNVTYNESNITTFQDKLNYLIIHESPSYKSFLVDKINLREYSKKVLGKDICVPIIKIYNKPKDINFTELPDKFVLKLNHGARMNIICNNKFKLNLTSAFQNLTKWLKINFGFRTKEFQYAYVKRKIFAEKFLGDNLIDYKIFCFNGEPKFIRIRQFLNNTNHTKIHNHYTTNWVLNDLESGLEGYIRDPNVKIERPKNLNQMLKYAKLLSQEFVFVRVDLYEVDNRVYLGELTFSPSNSFIYFKNKEQSIQIGKLMDITKIRKYLFNK